MRSRSPRGRRSRSIVNPRFGLSNPALERWCTWRPQALEGGAPERDYRVVAGAQATVSLHFFTELDRWAAIPGLEAEWEGIVATATGTQDWTRLTVSCRAPENAAKAVLFFSIEGEGTARLGSAEFGETGQ